MKKLFFDTNILLDIILERHPFNLQALERFKHIEDKEFIAYTSSISVININYIVKKYKG